MESCLSHSPRNRNRLECVLNSLRISGHLPQTHATRVTVVLCTCTDNPSVHSFWKDDNKLSELIDDAVESVTCKLKNLIHSGKLLPSCVFQMATILDSSQKSETSMNSFGLKKFIVALEKILEKHYVLFESTIEKESKMKHTTHPIKLHAKYVGHLIGKRGQNLKTVRTLSDCAISVERQSAGRMNDTVIIGIRGTQEGIQTACGLLEKEALEITRKRAIHEEQVRQHDQVRNKIRMARLLQRGQEMQSRGVIEDIKNSNRDEYERQQNGRSKMVDDDGFAAVLYRKRNRRKVKGHRLLAEGSRCLNCGEPFKGHNLSQSCNYHSGFVVDRTWTCCGRKTLDDQLIRDDHQITGCASSFHNFRPTQKRSGKANLNSSLESTSSLTKEGKDILRDLKREKKKRFTSHSRKLFI